MRHWDVQDDYVWLDRSNEFDGFGVGPGNTDQLKSSDY